MTEPEMALIGLGFTQVESLLYYELLRNSPATGYRLAQQIGKAPANIYQPLKALTQKGAVFVNEAPDEAPSYIPVPPRQLLNGLALSFSERQQLALTSLEKVMEPSSDVIVTQLRTVQQVLGQARAMLDAAKEVVLFNCMPHVYDLLRGDIDRARARGIEVAGLAYRREDEASGVPFASNAEEDVEARWPGHGLILVVDGSEQLFALLSRDLDRVRSAIYSDCVFLSCLFHNTLTANIRLAAIRNDPSQIEKAFELLKDPSPGQRHMARLARQSSEEPAKSRRSPL